MYLSYDYGLVTVTGPTVEPVTLDEVKEYCRVDTGDTSQDNTLNGLITSMRIRCEEICNRALITQTLKMTRDIWPKDWIFSFPRAPLQSVTTLKYVDSATGNLLTLASSNYNVDTTTEPGRLSRSYVGVWPAIRWQPAALELTFVAGYGLAAAVPQAIKDRIKAAVAYCYWNREEQDTEYLDRLFSPFAINPV